MRGMLKIIFAALLVCTSLLVCPNRVSADGGAGGEGAHAHRAAARHDAGARGRAIEVGGVESVEPQRGRGHGVEVRRLELRMAVVTGIAPALVVRHDEDDVRSLRRFGRVKVGPLAQSQHASERHKDSPDSPRWNPQEPTLPAVKER